MMKSIAIIATLAALAAFGTTYAQTSAAGSPPNDAQIAQIVLTATSLSGVTQVRLTINGEPFSAPLAGGAQTDRPLTREDYLPLLASG